MPCTSSLRPIRSSAALAALWLAGAAALAQPQAQPAPRPPPPTVGEAQSPRQDGTTRSGAPRPASQAASAGATPKSERDAKQPPGYRQGASTPRDSDAGSILGTPR